MPPIEVVTFDLDNTLWDVDEVIRNAERVTRTWFDAHVPELNAMLAADDFVALRRQIVMAHPELAHNLSLLRKEVFTRAIMTVGRSEAEAKRLAADAFALFLAERHKVRYYDGALDVLERLAGRHRLGALTNGNADVARLGLDRFFSFAFCAADVGAAKPAPQIFRAALSHTCVAAHQMIHIGDNLVDDIQGAAELGIATIWVNLNEAAHPDSPAASRTVTALKAIPKAIAAIEAGG
jgi:HAD superfamily hydrolase (TIGR01549 family)